MKRAYILAAIFTVLAVGLSSLILFGGPMPLEVRLVLSLGLGIALIYIGSAIVFLLALKGYTHQLKVAYRYICTSMFLVSIGTLQFLFLGALDAINTPWVTQGGAGIPFALMATFAYLGVRIFAKLVDVKSALVNVWVGQGVAVGVGIVTLVVVSQLNTEAPLNIPMVLNGYQAATLLMTAILMIKIRHVTGPLYSFALNWSSLHYVILALAGATSMLFELTLPRDHWYHVYSVSTAPYFIAGLCAMVSALYFNRIAYAENISNAAASTAGSKGSMTAVDVVLFLAGFASNRVQIDPILDKMRAITATMGGDKSLTSDQQNSLAKVYLAVEDFLINKETVRKFTQSDLRQMIELRFRESVDAQFWQSVQANQRKAPAAQSAAK